MSGRPRLKTYQYNKNGKFIKTFESLTEVRNFYYKDDKGKRPLFINNDIIIALPDNTFLCKERVGREAIKNYIKRLNSPYLLEKYEKAINIYNIDNVIIATVRSLKLAAKFTNIPSINIYRQLNNLTKNTHRDLYFKYD